MSTSVNQSDQSASGAKLILYRRGSIIALLAVFATDALTPLGLAHGILYLPAIGLAALSLERRWLLRIGLAALFLSSLGMLLAGLPEGFSLVVVLVNRILSLLAIGIVLTLCLTWLSTREQRQNTQHELTLAQQQTRRLKTTLDMISHQAGIGHWLFDQSTEKLYWSELINRMHGLAPGESPPLDGALSYYPEPGRTRLLDAFDRCRREGKAYSVQLPLQLPAGRQRLVYTSGRALFNDDGLQIGVVGTLQDLNASLEPNRQFSDHARALQQQLDALPIIVWSALSDGTIDYFNQALSDFSGVPRDDLSAPGEWLTLLHPDDQDRCTDTWLRSIELGRPYEIQFRLRRYDGTYRWHQVQATPARNLNGVIMKWYGSAVEIPEPAVAQ